jgi:hypothetical protein
MLRLFLHPPSLGSFCDRGPPLAPLLESAFLMSRGSPFAQPAEQEGAPELECVSESDLGCGLRPDRRLRHLIYSVQ